MAELNAFVFTDICRSVDLKNEMVGRSVSERDSAFIQQILIPHRAKIEARLIELHGRVVSTAGDGHFLVFDNTVLAAQWAIEVQNSHQEAPISTPSKGRVEVRISMHVGVPQSDPSAPDNFIGKTVDYASRLNGYATGDQILVSRSVMAILDDQGLDGVKFHAHGLRPLKGIGQVEIYELLYGSSGPRKIRQSPKSDSNRQWTVNTTQHFDGGVGQLSEGTSNLAAPTTTLKRIANYQLEELLGRGGMGEVYKARHLQFNRVRAVKIIKPELVASGNQELISRFYQEIKAIGALEHRNIVVAIDSSSPMSRVHYLVMEYIEGVPLDELIEQHGPLSVADAAEIARQTARGLHFIHVHGMVHRDIKPSNLMLTTVDSEESAAGALSTTSDREIGIVKILDLGLALLTGEDQSRFTQYDNRVMGSAMYMSPEQWKTTSVDIRSDIYSLGCTLYHLLAGTPPFADSDLRPEKAHEKSRLPRIQGTTHISGRLWDVLLKMTAKSPGERYATPAEVADALAPFSTGHDLAALVRSQRSAGSSPPQSKVHTHTDSRSRADTWLSRASRLSPTRRWLLWRLAPALVLVGLVGGFWLKEQRDRSATDERTAQETLPVIARVAATKTLAGELEKRFDVLARAAADPKIRQQLISINASPTNRALWAPLKEWLLYHYDANQERTPADCWFVNDALGTQVARTPHKDSVGQNFAYRDYFHGQGRDLTPEEGRKAGPIRQPNLSAVYKSTTTGSFKVAFSVPVWNESKGSEPKVLGVLSMSVDLGEFTVLERELRGRNQVVLIDLREDFIEQGKPQRGLILHHPQLDDWWEQQNQELPPRVNRKVLEAMQVGDGGFVTGYDDPMPANTGRLYWGAFEPVTSALHSAKAKRKPIGWMVLVQSQMPE